MTTHRLVFKQNQNLPRVIPMDVVQRLLQLSPSVFRRYFIGPITPVLGRVKMADVITFLDAHAVGIVGCLSSPPRLLSETDIAPLLPVDGHPATPAQIRRFCRRKPFPLPHFRFGATIYRFPFGAVEWWSKERRCSGYVDAPFHVGSSH